MVNKMRDNYFMEIAQNKYLGKNPIIKWLNYRKYKKECNKIRRKSHTIGSLWFFAEFIRLAEVVYFFDNKRDSYIFSSRSYEYGKNGFVITDKDIGVTLTCELDSDDQVISITIKRHNGSNMVTKLVYENNHNRWKYPEIQYGRVLIDNAIAIINKAIIYVIDFCWNANGSYDLYTSKR